eukprot:3045054-Karenia_brevis.AAC.1
MSRTRARRSKSGGQGTASTPSTARGAKLHPRPHGHRTPTCHHPVQASSDCHELRSEGNPLASSELALAPHTATAHPSHKLRWPH